MKFDEGRFLLLYDERVTEDSLFASLIDYRIFSSHSIMLHVIVGQRGTVVRASHS